MFRWMPYAMVRITAFLATGILFSVFYPGFFADVYPLLSISVAGFFLLLFFKGGRKRLLCGFLGLSAVFFLGYLLVQVKDNRRQPTHILHTTSEISSYQVVITRYPEERERSWRSEARILASKSNDEWVNTSGNLLLYFSKTDFASPYLYGDVLLIRGSPSTVAGPRNPEEFDFRKYLAGKRIYHQHFLRKGQVILLENKPDNMLLSISIHIRSWAESKLKEFVQGDRQQATVSALVLGVTDGLDNELLQAYASTGALHILAVSGLHVSIIYWIVLFLLKPITRTSNGKWMLAFFSILILWGYAMITGLSPSVLRAVMMFTFVAMAKPFRRSTNIYNTLAASAFCLLLYDPLLLLSVGFQLSYIAVFGIVFLQPRIYRWWEPAHKLPDEIWKVSSVSIAAQLAALPISLLYFHQFPNYFLIANLLIIPIAFIVLVMGLMILPLSLISIIATGVGYLLTWIIKGMNYFVFVLGNLPYSVIGNIYINGWQCLLLAGMILSLVLLFTVRRFGFLIVTIVCAVSFSLLQWNHFTKDVHQGKVTVYHVSAATAIDLTRNGKSAFLADEMLYSDSKRIGFHILSARIKHGVRDVENDSLPMYQGKGFTLIRWNGLTILRIFDRQVQLPEEVRVDFVIVSQNSMQHLKQLGGIQFRTLILDSSNSNYASSHLEMEGTESGKEVYNVANDGAFEYSM